MHVVPGNSGVLVDLSWEELTYLLSALDIYVDENLTSTRYEYEVIARKLFVALDDALRKKDSCL